MRLDHIAYRVADKWKTARFFIECFDYRLADDLPDGFEITFEDGTKANCLVLVPPEKFEGDMPWSQLVAFDAGMGDTQLAHYHLAPELFISEGTPGSIVEAWVKKRDGVGGIHHLAYQVDSVAEKMEEWKAKGYAEFTTEAPLTCPGLTQVFTKPSALTGIIYEFIERSAQGFCRENVKDLMNSTKDIS